jgi:hypothetical protein
VIVEVVVVNSVLQAERLERGQRDKSQRVGQLLPDRGPEWMGICHHEQETGPPSIILQRDSIITACTLCKY